MRNRSVDAAIAGYLAQTIFAMKSRSIAVALAAALVVSSAAPDSFASQLVLNSTGGTASLGSDFTLTGSTVAGPAGTVSIDCPITAVFSGTYAVTYDCAGGSYTFNSNDGTTSVSAPFTAGALVLTASGGGRGGNIHYYYSFSGNFSGTQTTNSVVSAINGESKAAIGPLTSKLGTATACCTATGVNSAYSPVYITDSSFSQLIRSDDLNGTNKQVLGGTGTGAKQFYGPRGVALDSSGRIYVADVYNCRIDRMDDITGANWTTFGTCGSGANQFSTGGLADIAVDSNGRIYVADPGNARIDSFDDMTGANWTTYGTSGSGTDQFIGATGVAVDSSNRIYIPDAGNRRIIRVDDMNGTNWTTLSQSPVINGYIFTFGSPSHIAIDPTTAKIEVADGNNIIRVDDMTGANWVSTNTGNTVQTLSIDDSGTTFLGGMGLAMLDDVATGSGFGTSNMITYPGGIVAVPVPSPVPAVTVAPGNLTYGVQNTGTTSAAQNVVLTNFGEEPLAIGSIGTTGDFSQTNNCPSSLIAGTNCTISVTYAPTKTGPETGALTITDNAFTGTQTVALSGTGTAPIAGIYPSSLTFQTQAINTTSGAQTIFLGNSGTGAMTFSGSGIATTGDFAQTNNCGAALAPGISCAIAVTFTPTVTGADGGSLTITSNAAPITVSLSGTGSSTAPKVAASPESLIFPTELINVKSAIQTVVLKNSGTTSVGISSTSITGNFAKTGTCPLTLGAGKSCTISVTFTPTAAGTRSGVLTFSVSTGAITVALNGTGTSTATGFLTVSPTSVSFPGTAVGDNPDQVVTITNTNGVPSGIRSIAKSGSTTFTITKSCGTTLAAYASCTVDVTFKPTVTGSFTGTLTVSESSGTIHKVPLSGSATVGGN